MFDLYDHCSACCVPLILKRTCTTQSMIYLNKYKEGNCIVKGGVHHCIIAQQIKNNSNQNDPALEFIVFANFPSYEPGIMMI